MNCVLVLRRYLTGRRFFDVGLELKLRSLKHPYLCIRVKFVLTARLSLACSSWSIEQTTKATWLNSLCA